MMHGSRLRKAALAAIAAGALLPGCLADLQFNLDLLLGADAIGNALLLPYTAAGVLARTLLNF